MKPEPRYKHWLRALPVGAALLLTNGLGAEPPQYTLELLGVASDVENMNIHGMVVGGFSDPSGLDMRAYVAGPAHPYTWLPLPEGYERSWANGINDAGVIVGGVSTVGYPNEHGDAVVWTPNGLGGYDVELLGHLPGHIGSVAVDINNRGDIIGKSMYSPGLGPGVWFNAPSGILDISSLGAPSTLEAMNDGGVVVGFNGAFFDIDTLQPMPLPPNPLGLTGLYAINNREEVAGGYGTGDSSGAVCWTRQHGWQRIGQTGGQSAQLWAWSISENGVVVADTLGSYPWYLHVAVHDAEHGTLPLESLIAPGQGNWAIFTLSGGAVDAAGRIAVIAQNQDTSEYGVVILTPVIEGIPGDLDGDGIVGFTDLLSLLGDWGPCPPPCPPSCPADLDGDCQVGFGDLLIVLANWG